MKTHTFTKTRLPQRQLGAAIVEFALVMSIFFMLLMGIFEFGRMLFTWNTAVEVTRRAARLAIVCDNSDAERAIIQSKVLSQIGLPINATDIHIYPNNASGDAMTAEISINASAIQYFIPFVRPANNSSKSVELIFFNNASWNLQIPQFSTTLTRESLSNGGSNASDTNVNPDCF